jgi:hypothetical protein
MASLIEAGNEFFRDSNPNKPAPVPANEAADPPPRGSGGLAGRANQILKQSRNRKRWQPDSLGDNRRST